MSSAIHKQQESGAVNKRRSREGGFSVEGLGEWDVGGRLSYLPSMITMSPGLDLLVSGLPPSRIPEAYGLVCAAAARGDNMGLDEFPDEESFRATLDLSDAYIAQEPEDGTMKAVLVIEASNHSRSNNPLYADICVVLHPGVHGSKVYHSIIRLGLQFLSDLGYEGALVSTFASHTDSMLALRAEGFVVVGCIPYSGYIANRGWAESMVLFKEVTAGNVKRTPCMKAARSQVRTNPTSAVSVLPMSIPSINSAHGSNNLTNRIRSDDNYGMTKGSNISPDSIINGRPKLTYFPCVYAFPGGNKVVLNYIQDDEVADVYALFLAAARAGQGYGEDEFNDLKAFRNTYVKQGHAILARHVDTGKIVASLSVSPTAYCRSCSPPVADAYMLVDPTFRGKGIGMEVVKIVLRVMRDLGYKGCVADTFVTNIPMYKLMITAGFNTVAYMPNGAFVKGTGWTDMVVLYKSLEENLNVLAKFESYSKL